eukprot:1493145-Rhodomonas_salina.1
MVAAQSVAQREITDPFSSVVPANRSGPMVNTQLAPGMLEDNFDTNPYTDLNLVAPNIISSTASNLRSHPLSSADLSCLQPHSSIPSGTPQPSQHAQSTHFTDLLSSVSAVRANNPMSSRLGSGILGSRFETNSTSAFANLVQQSPVPAVSSPN